MDINQIGNTTTMTGITPKKSAFAAGGVTVPKDAYTPSSGNSSQADKDLEALVRAYSRSTEEFVRHGMEELKSNANKMGVLAAIGTAAAVVGFGAAVLPLTPLFIGAGAIGVVAGVCVRNMAYPKS